MGLYFSRNVRPTGLVIGIIFSESNPRGSGLYCNFVIRQNRRLIPIGLCFIKERPPAGLRRLFIYPHLFPGIFNARNQSIRGPLYIVHSIFIIKVIFFYFIRFFFFLFHQPLFSYWSFLPCTPIGSNCSLSYNAPARYYSNLIRQESLGNHSQIHLALQGHLTGFLESSFFWFSIFFHSKSWLLEFPLSNLDCKNPYWANPWNFFPKLMAKLDFFYCGHAARDSLGPQKYFF